VVATRAELRSIILHPERLPEWWPAAFLEVDRLHPPDRIGAGGVYRVNAKGLAPFTVRMRARVTHASDRRICIHTQGDFDGRARITCRPLTAPASDGTRRWEVRISWWTHVHKPLLRALTPLLKPLLVHNHRWAMARGEIGLERTLDRGRAVRRGIDPATFPPPPGPTFPHNLVWLRQAARRRSALRDACARAAR
jgi:hypothetical protein